MDGDNLPLRNPEALFDSPQFRLHGNLFWPDFWTGVIGHNPDWLRPSAYRLFDLKPPWLDNPDAFATTETGQILINRCSSLHNLQCLIDIACLGMQAAWVPNLL